MKPQMQNRFSQLRFLPIHTLSVLALAVLLIAVSPAAANSYGGRAFGAYVNVPTAGITNLYLSDTGPLPATGGWEGAGSPSENIPTVLSANVLNAVTSGVDGDGNSSASLADIVVFPGQPAQLTASFVLTEAQAGASGGKGTTEVHDLIFGGIPVTVTGLPNQVVTIPGVATLIINEQTISPDGNSAVVNGLRLTLVTGDEVKLASASTEVNPLDGNQLAKAVSGTFSLCKSSDPRGRRAFVWPRILPAHLNECLDFVTGGGFFELPNSTRSGRVNFGFNAGPRSVNNPEIKGHLNLKDHGDGTHVSGVNVETYFQAGDFDHCRMFEGDATVNGVPGFEYSAFVCDFSEPGRDDRFRLVVTGPGFFYLADNFDDSPSPYGGELDGGNEQLHKSKCSNTASSFGPSV